ncbi:MAG TPA: FMN-binding protein [Limnochordia bacterium]|nr:FMN-binding protein [Limnochordia bacterium]
MKKWMKRMVFALCVLGLCFLGIALWATDVVQEQLASLIYENVSLTHVADGTHYGETEARLVSVKVAVLVKNYIIQSVELLQHDSGLGRKAETIVWEMVKENDWAVDAISGATLSSEAIKSAVSKALAAGQME